MTKDLCTYGGERFTLGRLEAPNLESIAHGLSNLCRFTGQCNHFYSVASHSLLVSRLLSLAKESARTQLMGLLHDGQESVLGDLNPVAKELAGEGYQKAEHQVQLEIMKNLVPLFDEYPAKVIKKADNTAVRIEGVLNVNGFAKNEQEELLVRMIYGKWKEVLCVPPEVAEEWFLARYWELENMVRSGGG